MWEIKIYDQYFRLVHVEIRSLHRDRQAAELLAEKIRDEICPSGTFELNRIL